MHDCKIPKTTDLREAQVKGFVSKLALLEKEFSDAE
jgi:hypothetical protein